MRRLLFAALIAFSPSAFASDGCGVASGMLGSSLHRHKDARTVAIFERVVQRGNFQTRPLLCEFKKRVYPPARAARVNEGDTVHYVVALSPHLREFSVQELEGTIAHELAHISRNLRGVPMALFGSYQMMLEHEKATDVLAVQWVGREAVIAALKAVEKRTLSNLPSDVRQIITEEIALRVREIHSLP